MSKGRTKWETAFSRKFPRAVGIGIGGIKWRTLEQLYMETHTGAGYDAGMFYTWNSTINSNVL